MKTINSLNRAVQLFMLTCLVSSCLKETAFLSSLHSLLEHQKTKLINSISYSKEDVR
ncbi:hypothetical protein IX307_002843 [Bacteroides pyogenes]|nr:hypothetical protein [Bacteroides pyogenes]MBR8788489.1 hypothetical protein [Bacteroides pyogenes]MBR8796890.1 hypothetical protein [Bacteroides pyogenes]